MRFADGGQARALWHIPGLLCLSRMQKHEGFGQIDRRPMPGEMRRRAGGTQKQAQTDFLLLFQLSQMQVRHLGQTDAGRLPQGRFQVYAFQIDQNQGRVPILSGL